MSDPQVGFEFPPPKDAYGRRLFDWRIMSKYTFYEIGFNPQEYDELRNHAEQLCGHFFTPEDSPKSFSVRQKLLSLAQKFLVAKYNPIVAKGVQSRQQAGFWSAAMALFLGNYTSRAKEGTWVQKIRFDDRKQPSSIATGTLQPVEQETANPKSGQNVGSRTKAMGVSPAGTVALAVPPLQQMQHTWRDVVIRVEFTAMPGNMLPLNISLLRCMRRRLRTVDEDSIAQPDQIDLRELRSIVRDCMEGRMPSGLMFDINGLVPHVQIGSEMRELQTPGDFESAYNYWTRYSTPGVFVVCVDMLPGKKPEAKPEAKREVKREVEREVKREAGDFYRPGATNRSHRSVLGKRNASSLDDNADQPRLSRKLPFRRA